MPKLSACSRGAAASPEVPAAPAHLETTAEMSVDLPGDSWRGVVAVAPYLGNRPGGPPSPTIARPAPQRSPR